MLVKDSQSMFHDGTTSDLDQLLWSIQPDPGADSTSEDDRNVTCTFQWPTPSSFDKTDSSQSRFRPYAVYQRTNQAHSPESPATVVISRARTVACCTGCAHTDSIGCRRGPIIVPNRNRSSGTTSVAVGQWVDSLGLGVLITSAGPILLQTPIVPNDFRALGRQVDTSRSSLPVTFRRAHMSA